MIAVTALNLYLRRVVFARDTSFGVFRIYARESPSVVTLHQPRVYCDVLSLDDLARGRNRLAIAVRLARNWPSK